MCLTSTGYMFFYVMQLTPQSSGTDLKSWPVDNSDTGYQQQCSKLIHDWIEMQNLKAKILLFALAIYSIFFGHKSMS